MGYLLNYSRRVKCGTKCFFTERNANNSKGGVRLCLPSRGAVVKDVQHHASALDKGKESDTFAILSINDTQTQSNPTTTRIIIGRLLQSLFVVSIKDFNQRKAIHQSALFSVYVYIYIS